MRLRKGGRIERTLRTRARHDELCDAARARAREHIVEVVTKRFVREVRTDVNKLHGLALECRKSARLSQNRVRRHAQAP